MADLLYVVVIIAFFALMVAFVRVCERIVGTDEAVGTESDPDRSESTTATNVKAEGSCCDSAAEANRLVRSFCAVWE